MIAVPDGFAIRLGIQEYCLVGITNTVKETSWKFLQWDTVCPECQKPIVVSTSIIFDKPARRCSDCKAPGRPVRKRLAKDPSP